MEGFSLKTKLYILGTITAGAILILWHLFHIQPLNLPIVAVLSLLASLSLIFKVIGATDRSHYNISFLLYSFTFVVLGLQAAFIVIIISNVVEWMYHKYPWYIQSFNITSYLLILQVSSLAYQWINPRQDLLSFYSLAGVMISMAVFTFLNHMMVGIVVLLARGESFSKSGVFEIFGLLLDYSLLCIGGSTAFIWTINPFATILSVVPLYLIYTTLKVPALERKSNTDAKTGLYNSEFFSTAVQNELERSQRFDHPISIVMGDLDLLRNINNTYGHLAGDITLVGVAEILKKCSRDFDVVSRFGGEEYAILMPETSIKDAYQRIDAIREEIARAQFTVQTSVTPIQVTMSFGIASRERGMALTMNELLHNADVALYHAKLTGRNRVVVYAEEGKNPFEAAELARDETIPLKQQPLITNDPIPQQPPEPQPQTSQRSAAKEPITQRHTAAGSTAETRRHAPWAINLYIAGLALLAATLMIFTYRPGTVDWIGLVYFALMVAITESLSLDIYVRDNSVSTSAAPVVAGFLLFGPMGVAVLSVTFAIVALIKHKSYISRFIFNASNQMIAGAVCALVFMLLGKDFLGFSYYVQLTVSLAAALVVFAITSLLISIVIDLNTEVPFQRIWTENYSWLLPYYLVIGLMAYILINSYRFMGPIGMLGVLLPLLMLRFSQAQYINRTKAMVDELQEKNARLEGSAEEIRSLNDDLMNALASAIELRDHYSLNHSKHVSIYSTMIAQEMGMPADKVELLRKAGLLHDIGKLGIPDAVLLKPDRLTHEEYEVIKQHVDKGTEVIKSCDSLQELLPIILHHHEHFDGSGYPGHLKGEQIPLEARIIAVADSVEAMASDRRYRKALPMEEILQELQRYSGKQFDPAIVEVFLRMMSKHGNAMIVNSAAVLQSTKQPVFR